MLNDDVLILSVGTAVPRYRISQQQFHSTLSDNDHWSRAERLMLRNIYRNSGISYRYSVVSEFNGPEQEENLIFFPNSLKNGLTIDRRMEMFQKHGNELALAAVEDAFSRCPEVDRSEVTHLITFSCTGMTAPGIDVFLASSAGIDQDVERTCVNFMGCYAAIAALRLAKHICVADPSATVLLCGVELCTLHYSHGKEQDQLVANALFGDGAAAVIVAGKNKNAKVGLSMAGFYSAFNGSGKDMMTWNLGAHTFDLRLSSYVPDLIKEDIAEFLEKLFSSSKMKREMVKHYAIHPGGVKILEACEQALGVSKEENCDSYSVLDQFGNMSSVTVLFVLQRLLSRIDEYDSGELVLSAAFGPGLTMESMLLKTCRND